MSSLGKLMPDVTELTGIILPEQSVTLGDRIAAGGYDWKDDAITAQWFPLTLPAGPPNLVLVHFNKVMTSKQVEQWAAESGYEVAWFEDLLAVGGHSDYRDLQRQFPIIQIGSFVELDGRRDVPYLDGDDAKRLLCLSWYVDDWDEGCRFLLRCK